MISDNLFEENAEDIHSHKPFSLHCMLRGCRYSRPRSSLSIKTNSQYEVDNVFLIVSKKNSQDVGTLSIGCAIGLPIHEISVEQTLG